MNTVLFLKFFAGLMAIMNPLINLPIFLNLTKSESNAAKIRIAFISCITVLIILIGVAYSGQNILGLFGISIGGFQIAGGILVGGIALGMLHPSPSKDEKEVHTSPAIVPLGLPIMAGPGAISKTIAFSSNAVNKVDFDSILMGIACGALLIFIVFVLADFLNRLLGKTGMNTITKIMAILLGAIAVEMIVQGTKAEFGL